MLMLNNVEVMYLNVILVLRGVSLEVGDGKIVALLGSNGAGKTTALKAISGLLKSEEGRVTAGSIEFDGHRLDRMSPEAISRLGIIQVLEGRRIFEHFSVEENLMVGAHLRRDMSAIKKDLDLVYEYFPVIKDLRRQTAGYLSGGEQQMVILGRALMARPKVMLLDEPSLGLAPLLVQEIFDIVKRINAEQGTSMLLVEQNARAALSISHYGYVLENGRVVLDGPGDKLINNEDIKEFYLGLSSVGKRGSYREVKHYKRRKRWL
jgi:branched-chain amino acid transport system ATP-binding protein